MQNLLAVVRNRNLALLLAGRLVSSAGDWLYAVALSVAVYGYSHHNAFYVGLLYLARLIPYVVLSPIMGAWADRMGYRRAMIVADLGRMAIVGALALVLSGAIWPILFPLAFAVSSLNALFQPASYGLIPALVEAPEQQLAANALRGQFESLAMILGSALGGLIAGAGHTRELLLIQAATFGVSAVSLWFIRVRPALQTAEDEPEEEPRAPGFVLGLRLLLGRPLLVFAAAVMLLPEVASGSVVVWIVPYAVQALHLGNAGVGYLFSALGVGSVVGGFAAALVGGNLRLDVLLAVSVALGGAALAFFGVVQLTIVALVMILIMGLAETVEYAAYETILQQASPPNMIGQAAGTMNTLLTGMMLLGSVVSGLLAATLGLTISMVGMGIVILVVAGGATLNLRRQTGELPQADALEAIPAFAQVSPAVRAWAVRRLIRRQFEPGTTIFRQGDAGDTFYAIAAGRAEVDIQQAGGNALYELAPGQFFGEIALLQNIPRTATVRALDALTTYTLSREDFQELQARAGEFNDSILETANLRLRQNAGSAPSLATRI